MSRTRTHSTQFRRQLAASRERRMTVGASEHPAQMNPTLSNWAEIQKALDPQRQKAIEKDWSNRQAQHKRHVDHASYGGNSSPKWHGVPAFVLRMFARMNPWIRTAVDIRKREIAAARWGIVPNLDREKEEIASLQRQCVAVQMFPELVDRLNQFPNHYISDEMTQQLIQACGRTGLNRSEIGYRFAIALDEMTATANTHAAKVLPLFENPNRNGQSWDQLLLAIIPDLLVLDSGCLELRRSIFPSVSASDLRPRDTNSILEMNWVDGATVRPCLDIHGDLLGGRDPNATAYEQWIDGRIVEQGHLRRCDLLRIVENPQTDIDLRGYGFSRVESLVITSVLEARGDQATLEQYRRDWYGTILNIQDQSIYDQYTLNSFRDWWTDSVEQTKAVPFTAFDSVQAINVSESGSTSQRTDLDKRKNYVQRVASVFEMSMGKLSHYEDANRSTSEVDKQHGDQGLFNLMDTMDNAINRGIVDSFGYSDIRYTSSVDRMEQEQLELAEQRQKLGIDEVNDTRLLFGRAPAEHGDKPIFFYESYYTELGRVEAQKAEEIQPVAEEGDEDPDIQEDVQIADDMSDEQLEELVTEVIKGLGSFDDVEVELLEVEPVL